MENRELEYKGSKIRITPDGLINIGDVAIALGKTRTQWVMEKTKNEDLYEGHLGSYSFTKRSPGSTVIDLEGLEIYLRRTENSPEEASRLLRFVRQFLTENVQLVEAEEILAETKNFLEKLKSIPTELASEYIELKKKIDAAV